jgi:hypothetical protein
MSNISENLFSGVSELGILVHTYNITVSIVLESWYKFIRHGFKHFGYLGYVHTSNITVSIVLKPCYNQTLFEAFQMPLLVATRGPQVEADTCAGMCMQGILEKAGKSRV